MRSFQTFAGRLTGLGAGAVGLGRGFVALLASRGNRRTSWSRMHKATLRCSSSADDGTARTKSGTAHGMAVDDSMSVLFPERVGKARVALQSKELRSNPQSWTDEPGHRAQRSEVLSDIPGRCRSFRIIPAALAFPTTGCPANSLFPEGHRGAFGSKRQDLTGTFAGSEECTPGRCRRSSCGSPCR